MTLLILHYPPEQKIQIQEHQALTLRQRINQARWCKLYAVEMKEASMIYRMIIQ